MTAKPFLIKKSKIESEVESGINENGTKKPILIKKMFKITNKDASKIKRNPPGFRREQHEKRVEQEQFAKQTEISKLEALFCEKFPVFAKNLPLKKGIHLEFREQFPEISHEKIKHVLKKHAKKIDYLKNVAIGTYRYDLNGLECEKISDTDKEFSLKKLLEAN